MGSYFVRYEKIKVVRVTGILMLVAVHDSFQGHIATVSVSF